MLLLLKPRSYWTHDWIMGQDHASVTVKSQQRADMESFFFPHSHPPPWRWKAVGRSPCSLASCCTARLLWRRKRSGRRPLSHRPQSFCLEKEWKSRGLLTARQHECFYISALCFVWSCFFLPPFYSHNSHSCISAVGAADGERGQRHKGATSGGQQ